jgi:hypothetical protein
MHSRRHNAPPDHLYALCCPQAVSDIAQTVVAGLMPVAIVILLEKIHIEHTQRIAEPSQTRQQEIGGLSRHRQF